ncbi:hypothetical protein AVEN_142429-1 [Araneus ventricosus]|uniref:Uncharacterized protein n=1 Tax=Araneus ventricosus TaxID=182803 RepID=A0A4Y2IFV4_ARAVE|nr:hypothetical protein AVEN_142429-1 [Araneus ventricosus]
MVQMEWSISLEPVIRDLFTLRKFDYCQPLRSPTSSPAFSTFFGEHRTPNLPFPYTYTYPNSVLMAEQSKWSDGNLDGLDIQPSALHHVNSAEFLHWCRMWRMN